MRILHKLLEEHTAELVSEGKISGNAIEAAADGAYHDALPEVAAPLFDSLKQIAPGPARPAQRPLPPLAAALSAEGHLLATLPPDGRPPDMLGMAGVLKLIVLPTGPAVAKRAGVA